MKKLFLLLLFSLFVYANGEVHKGQTFYYYLLKESLGYDGSVFAKTHTDKEWIKLFKNDAIELKKELLSQNNDLQPFIKSDKFKKILPHLKAFVIQYASNKKNTPQCIE